MTPLALAAVLAAVLAGALTGGQAFGADPDNPGCPADPANAFTDDEGDTHEASIDCIAFWQIARGPGDGTYDPGGHVTRAQMASFVANTIRGGVEGGGAPLPQSPPDAFPDDEGSVHEPNIDALAAGGVVRGGADGTYNPNGIVTRAQMATFVNNAIGYITGVALTSSTDAFDDDDGNVHEPNIDALAEAGIVTGLAGGGYGPDNPVTRAQMATFIARAIGHLRTAGTWPDPDTTPPPSSTTSTTGGSTTSTTAPSNEGFAGTYTGTWTNSTAGTSGAISMTVTVNGESVTLAVDVGGDFFGAGDPAAASISGTVVGGDSLQADGTLGVFGPTSISSSAGVATWSSADVPGDDVDSFLAEGTWGTDRVIDLDFSIEGAGGSEQGTIHLEA
jgi:hypothetical protein